MKSPRPTPPQEELNRLLSYEPETGRVFWKARDRTMFSSDNACNAWNAKWAGKEAFTATDGKGYRCGMIFNVLYRAHRIIWAMVYGDTDLPVDHGDGCRTNNRLLNLEAKTHAENMRNQKLRTDASVHGLGVRVSANGQKWYAHIKDGEGQKYLGSFDSREQAVAARKEAEVQLGFHQNHGRAA